MTKLEDENMTKLDKENFRECFYKRLPSLRPALVLRRKCLGSSFQCIKIQITKTRYKIDGQNV